MEFEEILYEVGDSGTFQKRLLIFFGAPLAFISAFPGMALIFMVMTPRHWCGIPENKTEGCYYTSNSTVTRCTEGWVYDKTYFESTAVTKWDLICEDDHYASLIITLQIIGSLIGSTVYGVLADKYGRKTLCFSVILLASITNLLSVMVNSLFLFAFLNFLNGSVLPTMFSLPYILISELVSPTKRVHVNGVFNTCWMVGMCMLPAVAYLARTWIMLGIFSSFASAFLLLFWRFVPESPSWLISKGRDDDATKVMMRIGRSNKKILKEIELATKIKHLGEKIRKKTNENKANFFFFISTYPRLRRHFLILTFCWMSNSFVYLGLQYNVINLTGNVFLNFFYLSLVEAPGNILFWFLIQTMGRRWSGSLGFLGISLSCLLPLIEFPFNDVASSVIGKFLVSGVYMVNDQQGCEILPTVARSQGVGTGKSIGTAITLFTPFLAYLSMYGRMIPFIVISGMSFMAAVLSSFLPETLNENLPQTLQDAEVFGKNDKYFSFHKKEERVPEIEVSTVGKVEVPESYVK